MHIRVQGAVMPIAVGEDGAAYLWVSLFMKSIQRTAWMPACAFLLAAPLCAPLWAQTQEGVTAVLSPVMVSAAGYTESASTAPYSVGVITAEQIHDSGASSVSQAIMKLLGVPGTLDTSGGNNYGLDLKGFGSAASSNQVVIVDGMRLNDDDQSNANLGSIPITAVQRIEVLRGAGAVQYGGGATGGVIVITTYAGKGVQRKSALVLSGEVGSQGLVDERANAVLAAGNFSFDVAAQDQRTSGNRANFASENSNLSASGQWSNDWLRVGIKGGNSALHSGWPGSLTQAQFQADQTLASSASDWGTMATTNGSVFAEATLEDWTLNVDSAQRSKLMKSQNGYSDAFGTAANQSLRARNERKFGGIQNAFTVGFDQSQWVRSPLPSGTASNATTSGWYLSDDLTLPTLTRVSVGVRNEDEHKFDPSSNALNNNLTAWEFGVNQTLATVWNVYARAGQSYRLANIDDMAWTYSNIPLLPQVAQDQEMGVRWDGAADHAELRWFHSDIANEIAYDGTKNTNVGNTVHQGLELSTRHALGSSTDLRINVGAHDVRFASGVYAGKMMAMVPQQTASLGLDVRPAAGQMVNLGLNWVSEQKATFANTCAIPAYTTLDTRYAYTVRNWELSAAVKNMTDERYYTLAYGCSGGLPSSIYPEARRTFSVAARVSF